MASVVICTGAPRLVLFHADAFPSEVVSSVRLEDLIRITDRRPLPHVSLMEKQGERKLSSSNNL